MGIKIYNPLKKIKYWIDDNFREKAYPIPGSVLYCDLWGIVEHSGIYKDSGKIINLEIKKYPHSIIKETSFEEFTDSSADARIYVSCDKCGSVGDSEVSQIATSKIGEENIYFLLFNNCHDFCIKCIDVSKKEISFLEKHPPLKTIVNLATLFLPPSFKTMINMYLVFSSLDMEFSISTLKKKARQKIGATKWRLMYQDTNTPKTIEPDIQNDLIEYLNIDLTNESINLVKLQKFFIEEYLQEISDEGIPQNAINKIISVKKTLERVEKDYKSIEIFSKETGIYMTASELEEMNSSDLNKLALEFSNNQKIKKLIDELGSRYLSQEESTLFNRKSLMNHSLPEEVYGIEKGNSLVRLMPSEILNLADEELEVLFYAKYLENSLLNYQLTGQDIEKEKKKNKGPIIVSLDTSGSMKGDRSLKAKALLLSIVKNLKEENRDLYILLFSGVGEISEFRCDGSQLEKDVLLFLNTSFGGGTDFETPLNRSFEIIKNDKTFKKADILLITDGYFSMSDDYSKYIEKMKSQLLFNIYTVITDNTLKSYKFSNQTFNI